MSENGYIKLDRKILKWGWYNDSNTFRVFVHLLLTANYSDSEFRGHTIKRGQLVTGRKKLSDQLKMTEREVRTALDHLKATNEIAIETTSQYSIITIENYNKYQRATNKTTNKRPASDQQATNKTTTSKEYIKNNKKDKNIHTTRAHARERDTHDMKRLSCQDVVDLYNSICVSLPRVDVLTKVLEEAIAEVQNKFTGIDFEALFKRVEKSDFLTGRKTGWKGCSLNWILFLKNTARILNGEFDDFKKPRKDKKERNASYSLETFESKSLFND